ncbi:hypothetical protein F442_08454 [Phytophthora nicotianae P10297]|uniref:Uncharacterized protein n=1 Tax=Phytophthora nicotianae P10297 TaxID=1317064 RepID=W2ZCJ4_PHYNI|nr:hypothetical protein F442_08454 [Phytophthora nicotianae P10297]
MIGDNCSVNQEIGRKLGALPLIGCTSLRFQLAVNDVLANEETLLANFHALMIHLSTITCRAALRKVTPLAPAVRNATHWSILFSTVERYTKLHPALQSMDHVTISKYGIARFMLSESETAQATELLSTLFDSHEVTKALQDPTLTLIGVRRVFDWVSRQYPAMKGRLAPDSAVVNYPALETGITKTITGGRLTTREQEDCKVLRPHMLRHELKRRHARFWGPSFRKRPSAYYVHVCVVDTSYV